MGSRKPQYRHSDADHRDPVTKDGRRPGWSWVLALAAYLCGRIASRPVVGISALLRLRLVKIAISHNPARGRTQGGANNTRNQCDMHGDLLQWRMEFAATLRGAASMARGSPSCKAIDAAERRLGERFQALKSAVQNTFGRTPCPAGALEEGAPTAAAAANDNRGLPGRSNGTRIHRVHFRRSLGSRCRLRCFRLTVLAKSVDRSEPLTDRKSKRPREPRHGRRQEVSGGGMLGQQVAAGLTDLAAGTGARVAKRWEEMLRRSAGAGWSDQGWARRRTDVGENPRDGSGIGDPGDAALSHSAVRADQR